MIKDSDKEMIIKLKCIRVETSDLPHTVNELQEHRGTICIRVMIVAMANPLKHNVNDNTKLYLTISGIFCIQWSYLNYANVLKGWIERGVGGAKEKHFGRGRIMSALCSASFIQGVPNHPTSFCSSEISQCRNFVSTIALIFWPHKFGNIGFNH